MPQDSLALLLEAARRFESRATGKLITLLERGGQEAQAILREVYGAAGQARLIGITGAPGSGKSTLTDRLVAHCRQKGLTCAVVAVDPSSPFSGGAVLGDRIRMQQHFLDSGVFIRSMASRGSLGALAEATGRVVILLDAMGWNVIFIETVGVGQDEVDVVKLAESTVVVTVPGLGDDIQAVKAGIFEIADILVVNKADRDGADKTVRELQAYLGLAADHPPWLPPVLKTVASESLGIAELWELLEKHREHLAREQRGPRLREQAAKEELLAVLRERLLRQALEGRKDLDEWVGRIARRETDPYTAAEAILS